MRYSEVFIPGGIPTITYNPRPEHHLEDRIREVRNNLCKLVVITGQTKAGKTVLVSKIFPQDSSIWISGGGINSENDFWNFIVESLQLYTDVQEQIMRGKESSLQVSASSEFGIPFIKAKPGFEANRITTSETENSHSRSISAKIIAIKALEKFKIPIVIDDFHYIPREIQAKIVRAVKVPIMHGLPVILIAIPNRKYDSVKVEREMTGRIEHFDIPIWNVHELVSIAQRGFEYLKISISDCIIEEMATQAFGSPHLMQEFCKGICRKNGIEVSSTILKEIFVSQKQLNDLFTEIAAETGRPMFERLSRGPRSRTDRKERRLKNGTNTDIYGVVMQALQHIKPGISSIN